MRVCSKSAWKRLAILAGVIAIALVVVYFTMIRMPGRSFSGPLPPLTDAQRALAVELRAHVEALAGEIGPRCVLLPAKLRQARTYLRDSLASFGYEVREQTFIVGGVECANISVELKGSKSPAEIVIIGAHYDSCFDTPAANDNASGCAATLAIARRFVDRPVDRTVRFVFFVNEEPPYFQTGDMGSFVYAQSCKQRGENIVAMLSLETIGYYSDEPGSQTYPVKPLGLVYPTTGNFIGFVGNWDSRKLVRQAIGSFRGHAAFPSEGGALLGWIEGVGWSDHWAFWQFGYPAVMVTDTAPYRYPHYHQRSDTPEKLQYEAFSRVVEGLEAVVGDLAVESR